MATNLAGEDGSAISSDGGLLLHRELDDVLGLTDLAASLLVDARTGRNGRHGFAGLLRQSIYSRLAIPSVPSKAM